MNLVGENLQDDQRAPLLAAPLLVLFWGLMFLCHDTLHAQTLPLPERATNAPSGSEFAARVASLDLADREKEISAQILSGNVPQFLRKLCPIQVTNVANGLTNIVRFYVTPDYLAVGSDADYFLMPISPNTGQRIADTFNCSLPTP